MRDILTSQLKRANAYQQLEVYSAVYETSNVELIRSVVRQVWLQCVLLGPDGAHTLGSIISRCENLDCIHLYRCGISDRLLGIMAETMRGKTVRVGFHGWLDFRIYATLYICAFHILGQSS